jgi:hypothetical protein
MRKLRLACNADHVSNIPLGELNLEKKQNGGEFKTLEIADSKQSFKLASILFFL